VSFNYHHLPYSETNSFSSLVTDYLAGKDKLKPFYNFNTDIEGTREAIKSRKNFPINRTTLINVLKRQYTSLNVSDAVQANIDLLQHENTFTITTAHQPNLLSGYLYFIYKILHAIKLSAVLKEQFEDYNFVPVYYMGSEDNDLDELGSFRYNGKKYTWDGDGQKGAVGRMKTKGLKALLDNLFKELGPPGEDCEKLKQIIFDAYLQHETIASATQYLVNELFGRYGLVIVDPDDRELKSQFIDITRDDLLNETAFNVVSKQITNLSEHYKVQAHPRPVNLFYLKDDIRERIEKTNGNWKVINRDITWTEEELMTEVNEFPERFSPNVILRPLFQEMILPDIIFIGGGAEVAYWMQLKTLFDRYHVFFPSIHLRQSILWISPKERDLRKQLGLSVNEIFKPESELVHEFISRLDKGWETKEEMSQIEAMLLQLKKKAETLDPTLKSSAEASLTKIRYQVAVLEKKMLRAEKRKFQNELSRISRLKEHLFPVGGLQERTENFITYYVHKGDAYLDLLLYAMQPLKHEFLVIERNE
jgi:bacillithiol synthase